MSLLVTGKFQGDTAKFRQALTDRADEVAKIADESGPRARFTTGAG